MRKLFILLTCLALAGCATTSSRSGYTAGGINTPRTGELSDGQMIELFHKVYDEPAEDQIDRIAKDITITALTNAMEARRSREIKGSGVLKAEHKKVELKKWTDNDLLDTYRSLRVKLDTGAAEAAADTNGYNSAYWGTSSARDEEKAAAPENADETLKIMRLTAACSIENELSRRDKIASRWAVVGTAAGVTATIAARVALMLAPFLI